MLNSYKKGLALITILQLCLSCSSNRKTYYAYKVNTYGVNSNTGKQIIASSSLISYGNHLFEFKNRLNLESPDQNDSAAIINFSYDSIGVYLLTSKKKLYYEFDSFADVSRLIKKGSLTSKPSGFRFSQAAASDSTDIFYGPLKEVLKNDIQCFYVDLLSAKEASPYPAEQKLILIKKKRFNSLYRINGLEFTDKDYCIVGYSIFFPTINNASFQELVSLRPLTEEENKICKSLIKKSGL